MRYSFLASGVGMTAMAETKLPWKVQVAGPCHVICNIKAQAENRLKDFASTKAQDHCGVTSWVAVSSIYSPHTHHIPTVTLCSLPALFLLYCQREFSNLQIWLCRFAAWAIRWAWTRHLVTRTWRTSPVVFLTTYSLLSGLWFDCNRKRSFQFLQCTTDISPRKLCPD